MDANDGRANQRRRTRKDLLRAASRLMQQGLRPNLEEVAVKAEVSRATAYRHFPNIEHLLVEAALDVATPDPEALLKQVPGDDPVARMERVDDALHAMILANEPQLRTMLAHSVQRPLGGDDRMPARQNRRTPLIEAALAPARSQFSPASLRRLSNALALIVGTEAMLVCKDVLQLDEAEARKVRRWAIRALVEAARKPVAA